MNQKISQKMALGLIGIQAIAGCAQRNALYQSEEPKSVISYKETFEMDRKKVGTDIKPILQVSEISEENLIPLALNNSNIQAGIFQSAFVDALKVYNDSRYKPQVHAETVSKYDHIVRTEQAHGLEKRIDHEDTTNQTEIAVSQRFRGGLSGEIFLDTESSTSDGGDSTGGIRVEYLIPGLSYTLAQEQLNDLIRLQDPARDRADFVANMRSNLEYLTDQFYRVYRGNTEALETEKTVRYSNLLRIKQIIQKKLDINPDDSKAASDMSAVTATIEKSEDLINITLPAELETARKNLVSSFRLGEVDVNVNGIDDTPLSMSYEQALEMIAGTDPQLRNAQIEFDIADAQIEVAKQNLDVKLFGGVNSGIDHDRDESFIGLSVNFAADGREALAEAYRQKRATQLMRIQSRIDNVTRNTAEMYRVIERSKEAMDKSESDMARRQKAFEEAVNLFESESGVVDVDRLLGSLDDWVSSRRSYEENRNTVTLTGHMIQIRTGKYDEESTWMEK